MRVLLASWAGSTNLGDELLVRTLVERLHQRGVEVEVISLDPDATAQVHGVEAVGHREVGGVLAAVGRADAVLFGGGDLLQDITSPLSLPFHLSRVLAARLRRTPVAGIGLGVPPLVRGWSKAAIRASWPRKAPIAVRDVESRAALASMGIASELAADLAFGLPIATTEPQDVITVSLRPWHGGGRARARHAWEQGLDDPHLPMLASELDDVASATGLGLRFVAMQPDRDGPYHQRIAAHLRTAEVEFVTPDLADVVAAVGAGRLVIASRFHGIVCGLLSARPVVGLTYADKVTALTQAAPTSIAGIELTAAGISTLASAARAQLQAAAANVERRARELAALQQAQLVNDDVIDRVLHARR